MKKFRFPLERVRAWRRVCWEREEDRLEKAQFDLRRLQQSRQDLHATAEREAARLVGQPSLSSRDLASLEHLRVYVREEDRRIAEQCEKARLAVDQQRRLVLDARREYEAVEKLRERQFQGWQVQADRDEAVKIGELAIARWRQRSIPPKDEM